MSKLIMLPGDVSSSFVLNELPITKKYYDEVCIIDFAKNESLRKQIEEKYGFKYYSCKTSVLKLIANREFWKWLSKKYVWKEIAGNISFSYKGIKKLLYIMLYGAYSSQSKKIIDKEIEEYNGDIDLYAYWLSRAAFSVAQYNEERNEKIRNIVSRTHRYDLYFERNAMNYLPFRKYIDDNLDTIHFIAKDGMDYYDSKYKEYGVVGKANKELSRLGVYKTDFEKKEIEKDYIVIASCSNIIPVKRLDLIIGVLSRMKEYNIRWIHFGDGVLMDEMISLSEKKLDANSFKFFGKVNNSDLMRLYQENDVDFFINLSDSEGVPVSIMEAFSFGVPVIARNVGGNREIVNDDNGLLLESANIDEIVQSVKRFLADCKKDKEYYLQLAQNAYTTWDEMYNAEKNYNYFYEKLTIH